MRCTDWSMDSRLPSSQMSFRALASTSTFFNDCQVSSLTSSNSSPSDESIHSTRSFFSWLRGASCRSRVALLLHGQPGVLDAERDPFSAELLEALVVADPAANVGDRCTTNILSATLPIKRIAELVVRPALALGVFVLFGQRPRSHVTDGGQFRLDPFDAPFNGHPWIVVHVFGSLVRRKYSIIMLYYDAKNNVGRRT